jgi:lysophospholipase L1-like esterase
MLRHQIRPLAVTVLLLACCARSVALPPLAQDAVIVAFGDSLTSGVGVDDAHDYPAILTELAGRRVVNAGVPGEVTAEGLQRLPEVLNEHLPALVILIHGGNDILRSMDLAQTRANIGAMIRLARARGAAVAMLGVPQRGIILESAELYNDLAAQYGVPIDTETLSGILSDRALKSDPVHPNEHGYRALAAGVHSLLEESGAL